MPEPTKKDYQRRLDQIADIYADILDSAQKDLKGQGRCPYRTAKDICTAKFGCANRADPRDKSEELICAHDGTLDFRTAWETQPENYVKTKNKIKQVKTKAANLRKDKRAGMEDATTKVQTLFDLADDRQLHLATSCGRYGECHECIVNVTEGIDALTPRSEAENFLSNNYRLACQAEIIDQKAKISIEPLIRTPRILKAKFDKVVKLDPGIYRQGGEIVRNGQVIDKYRGNIYGLAVDLGTTTVVANLIDLETGYSVASASFENPQRIGGSDVMHRITYDGGTYKGELHKVLINALNREIEGLCFEFDFKRREIYEIVVAGNATMRDLFFNSDVQPIGQRPYKSPIELAFLAGDRDTTALTVEARKLRLRAHPKCMVRGLPLIASHVGGDTAASLLALDMSPDDEEITMLVDMGTNTEIVLAGQGRLMVASAPAGPAFEGGLVQYGMASYDGAIESIWLDDGEFSWRTIGNAAPVGLCGSGLIDILASLLQRGDMDEKGALVRKKGERNAEVIVSDCHGITISGLDISHLAQAKAASNAGQKILMDRFGINPNEIDQLYLAGGFASHVNIDNAVKIGLLAPVNKYRVIKAGNTSLKGSVEALLNQGRRLHLEKVVTRAEHIELETENNFFDIFVEACFFKPMTNV